MTKHRAGTQPVELGSAVVIATLMAAVNSSPAPEPAITDPSRWSASAHPSYAGDPSDMPGSALVPMSGCRDARILRASVRCMSCAGWFPLENWWTIAPGDLNDI
jgi:hypothetical protein